MGTADALRSYVTAMRRGLGLTQEVLGTAAGLRGRAVLDWENSTTYTVMGTALLEMVARLQEEVITLGGTINVYTGLDRLVGRNVTTADGALAAISDLSALLSDTARGQLGRVLTLLEEETRSGRILDDAAFAQTLSQIVKALGGITDAERRIIDTILSQTMELPPPAEQPRFGWLSGIVSRRG